MRTIAVDWSGAKRDAEGKIWLAEARDGSLVRLESGRSREAVTVHLAEEAERDPELAVGLDFAFSFPAWFLDRHDCRTGADAWSLAMVHNEAWLTRCEPPFWGRPGKTRPELPAHFRETEQVVSGVAGVSPKSVFQVGGAGAVGTASLRGMPHLLALAGAGFSVWPFDEPALPMVLEIYPRLLTGGVVKSDPGARRTHLERERPGLSAEHLDRAAASEDAFDAAVSALAMDRHADELADLARPTSERLRREGVIWWPGWEAALGFGLEEALAWACELHAGQTRKGPEPVPYIAHLLGVCSLVLEAGGDEEQAIAALLHDAAEDQGGRETLAEIRARFGDRVAAIVDACTDTYEESKPDWRPRKEAYVAHLGEATSDALLVACADKLYNARATLRDHRLLGDAVFERFNATREETLWYYGAVIDAFRTSGLDSWLLEELERVVSELERRASDAGGPHDGR